MMRDDDPDLVVISLAEPHRVSLRALVDDVSDFISNVRAIILATAFVAVIAFVLAGADGYRPSRLRVQRTVAGPMIRLVQRWFARVHGSDRGSVALYFAIMAIAALAMAGLVVDGGNALATRERAADVATQAARAGVDALTPASLRGFAGGTPLTADPAAAQLAANHVLAVAGATGTVVVSGSSVTVRATIHKRTAVLSAVGLTDISQTASATATTVYGGRTQRGG